jgi:hypothetical protein
MALPFLRRALPSILVMIQSVCWLTAQDSFDVHFAHFAAGQGYSTTFTLINTGTTAATGWLERRDANGNSLTAIQISVPPRGTNSYTVGRSGTLITGWASYSGNGGIVAGVATFVRQEAGVPKAAAGVQDSQPIRSASIPAISSAMNDTYAGYAIANPSSTPLAVRIRVYSSEGVEAPDPITLNIGPGRQIARFLHEDFPDLTNFEGSLVVTSESGTPFLATALLQVGGLLTVLPVIEN